jgi:hypothetical protein
MPDYPMIKRQAGCMSKKTALTLVEDGAVKILIFLKHSNTALSRNITDIKEIATLFGDHQRQG